MGTDASARFAAYPMVEEADATGVVAAVYARLLEQMPFVPSLFKSLALCPGYLLLAYEQSAPVLSQDQFGSTAQDLVSSVRGVVQPPADADVRAGLAEFAGPLSRMLLLAAGLRLALDGELDLPSAPGDAPAPRPVQPRSPAPSPWDAPAPRLYGEICTALETPIVNSIWRTLAGRGLLEPAWAALGPQVPASRPAADDLQARVSEAARRLPWRVAATPAALEQAGLGDARPGMAGVLDAYLATLPRVLVLVASSTDAG
ncbi:hypothetical protein [Blastococcus saxobsidens]|uniref:Uncharacterized protein n=1 Tax=Blastococcus saxobsidens (strain DD2) TaxID=1146883 RepID=H6RSL1_BLASD|nr:hypothetical protein [Blastococcus saxobsidens]CCG01762.1 protein of unknown function [Blastococcus saxobsidens DD2]